MTTDSLLDFIVSSECNNNVIVFHYTVWANGKVGSITDNGTGIYRFYEMTVGKLSAEVINEKPEANPIVATGIVAYCLHNRKNNYKLFQKLRLSTFTPKSIHEQFIGYTLDSFKQYKEKREQEPDSWRCNIETEFYTEKAILLALQQNKESEALLEFITPSDREFIIKIMQEYLLFLRKKRGEYTSLDVPCDDSDDYASGTKISEYSATNSDIDEIFANDSGKNWDNKVFNQLPQKGKQSIQVSPSTPPKWDIDEQRLRNHFKPIFKGEIKNHDDMIPVLISVIQSAQTDIAIGQIALQIYESKFFFVDNYKTFTSWYREFCAILGTQANPNYEKHHFKISEKTVNTTYFFLHNS